MCGMETNAPEHFMCPISMVIMTHPVRTETGHVFERRAIMEWIYFGKATCPLSRRPLHPSRFVIDSSLEQEIRQWRQENQVPEVDDEEDDSDADLDYTSMHVDRLVCLRQKILQARDQRIDHLRIQATM